MLMVFLLVFVFQMMVDSQEYACCRESLANGSVSYTLNGTFPDGSNVIWNKNGVVIASEDGETDKLYIVSKTENGYILKENYDDVVCKLESPQNGVSREIKCIEACKPEPFVNQGHTGSLNIGLMISLPLVFLLLTIITGIVMYKMYQRRCRRDNASIIEMQPVNEQDRDQDMDQDTQLE